MPSKARPKKTTEQLKEGLKSSILGPQNLGSGGPGPLGPPLDPLVGRSRISPRWGCHLYRAPTYDFAKISQKLHEIERIWTPGGGASKILLCRSATGSYNKDKQEWKTRKKAKYTFGMLKPAVYMFICKKFNRENLGHTNWRTFVNQGLLVDRKAWGDSWNFCSGLFRLIKVSKVSGVSDWQTLISDWLAQVMWSVSQVIRRRTLIG